MKPGLKLGLQSQMEVVVTSDMLASFGGELVHPVLSTVSMIYYMEWTGRRIILPYLEHFEEGIGAAIEVKHLKPAPLGSIVLFTAILVDIISDKVICNVKAEQGDNAVGIGKFTQYIIRKYRRC